MNLNLLLPVSLLTLLTVIVTRINPIISIGAVGLIENESPDNPTQFPGPYITEWSYDNTAFNGPNNWGSLNSLWTTCSTGKSQSPIDIITDNTIQSNNAQSLPLIFNYISSNGTKIHSGIPPSSTSPDSLINNGHTLQINYNPGSNIIVQSNNNQLLQYNLIQFHYHSPAEHTINGYRPAMEMHLVHKNPANGLLLVLAILFDTEQPNNIYSNTHTDNPHPHPNPINPTGSTVNSNIFLDSINWSSMPTSPGLIELLSIINIYQSLPIDLAYYYYSGSLTTPPCSEIVSWYILKQSVLMSDYQLNLFRSTFNSNNRPIQSINNRNITSTAKSNYFGQFNQNQSISSDTVSKSLFIIIAVIAGILALLLLISLIYIRNRRSKYIVSQHNTPLLTVDSNNSNPSLNQP